MKKTAGPVLVTGCPRSGLSMTAGILAVCGAFPGKTEVTCPASSGIHRSFENVEIRDQIMSPFLQALGADLLGQTFPASPPGPIPNLLSKVRSILYQQGYRNGSWLYKDARMSFCWNSWAEIFTHATWILVRREPEEIVRACLRTSYMKAHQGAEAWRRWVAGYENQFRAMKDAGLDVREVWPGRYLNGDFREIRYIVQDIGLGWNEIGARVIIKAPLKK